MATKLRRKARKRRRVRRPRRDPAPAIAVGCTDNKKTGPVSATYAAQQSCPVTCPLYGRGCYAEDGHAGIVTRRLNEAATGMTPEQVAVCEARAIDRLPPGNDLRLHVVGDCRTEGAAGVVAAAAMRYVKSSRCLNSRAAAWTYTHAWGTVGRLWWGEVSVLASVETWDGVWKAHERGYASAILVSEFENGKLAWTVSDGRSEFTAIPCPYQTVGRRCVDCRLCLDADKLHAERRVIAFRAHGARRESVVRTLDVLSGG